MNIHEPDLKAYELYLKDHPNLPILSDDQLKILTEKAKHYHDWTFNHQGLHNFLNFLLMINLFVLDILVSTFLPAHFPDYFYLQALLHGYLIYSLSTFLLNEGVAHNVLFLGESFLSKNLKNDFRLLTRLYFADPEHFKMNHQKHHESFGTNDDAVFTSFVNPKRFFLSLLPLASAFRFCDYKIHTGEKWTKSKILSEVLGRLFFICQFLYLRHFLGGWMAFLFIFIALWFAFILDRLRETTEHNLMGNSKLNGARQLGFGFWGWLVGGGPWGQPARLTHEIFPQNTWYHQLFLHHKLKKILVPVQKEFFLIKNFPKLLCWLLSENKKYLKYIKKLV